MNIKETINKLLPEDIKVKLKEHFAKLSDMPVEKVVEPIAPTEEKVKMATEVKLNDGTSLSVDGDIAIGSMVKLITPEGEVEAMDGEYVAEDGTSYSVMNGAISEIASKEVEAIEPIEATIEKKDEMPTMMAEIASLKNELAELKETVKLTLSAVNTIVSTPVVEPIESKVEFANMTAFQRFKASK
jgi:hypothetical protein